MGKKSTKAVQATPEDVRSIMYEGIEFQKLGVINYKPNIEAKESKGQIMDFKYIGESLWLYVKDSVTNAFDWISVNVQLSYNIDMFKDGR